jgi:pSer/pThr/pTyr-binding forkhead associated (FHA) protein
MPFEIGVVCGRCDRYVAMGTTRCACGFGLTLGGTSSAPEIAPAAVASVPEPPPPSLPARDLAPSAREPWPVSASTPEPPPSVSMPVQASAGLSEPPPSLFAADGLKPRRGRGAAVPAPFGEGALRVVEADSALSSARAFVQDGAADAEGALLRAESSPEELMDQAKNYVCRSCSTPVPLGHKFCGRCGAAIPPEIVNARTQFFGQLQMPGKAKLILIRGDGIEGLSYQLNAEQHVVGRNGQLVFPDDPFVSPRHANLFYRNGRLVVRDEGSLNGVFLRVRQSAEIVPGDFFLAGEQLFRVEGPPRANDGPAPDGTYFYSSPKHQSQFKLVQILEGGTQGMAVCARGVGLQIGREGGDMNFPLDLFMSAQHCKVDEAGGRLTLTDLNSRNGTYVRLKAERDLAHGDYLFIGRKLLRVEITAN